MEYLKNVVPSQLIAERGSNLVVINPGSANVRIGFAHQALPFNVPHCIARHIKEPHGSRSLVKDQLLNSQVTTPSQQSERKNAYDAIAALLKIPTLDDEVVENSSYHKMGQGEVYNLQLHSNNRTDSTFAWTNVILRNQKLSPIAGADGEKEITDDSMTTNDNDCGSFKYKDFICGEEALKISSSKPYCLCNPIRRGRFNVSESYSLNQILEDLSTIWDWILIEKLQIPKNARSSCSAVLVIPETFDPREIKESISIVLQDLGFSTAVVHQEGLAATSGNGLSTACVVNLGAQVTSVICIEDGVALPSTTITLPFGGDDISRCLLWVQETHQTWPNIRTRPLQKSIDLFMLNKIKESSCQIREGEFDEVSLINSFEEGMPVGCYKSRLSSLNVPPMGLFFPELLLPEAYPPPPLPWFCDYEDMLDDPWKPDNYDNMYLGSSTGPTMWDSYPVFPTRTKRVDKVGLADAITNSILSTGRIDLQRKLFCSIQLIGGVALTSGIVAATEDRVLHAIPSNEAIDTVEVLQSRSNPTFVPWKGGAILGILDFGRESWIHREDWIQNAIHIGSGRKYKDSYYLQALAMSYINY